MWPWGHLALAYLAYAAVLRIGARLDWTVWTSTRPSGTAAILVALGSQVPDLVDKPLAWTVSVLPTGRSLGHSLVVVGPALAAAYVLARRRGADRTPVVALGVGVLAHLFGDALYPLVEGQFDHLVFLLWPALEPVEYEVTQSFAAHFALLSLTPTVAFEFLLVGVALVVWYRDGTPGLATVRNWSRRVVSSVSAR